MAERGETLAHFNPDGADRCEKATFSFISIYLNRALGELVAIERKSGTWDLFAAHYRRYCEGFCEGDPKPSPSK
jgi:hypothetical protein